MTSACQLCGGPLSRPDVVFLRRRGIVVWDGKAAKLTEQESRFLEVLTLSAPRVVAKSKFLDNVYLNPDEEPEPKIVDVIVCKLRRKMKGFGVQIETHWGAGYSLKLASDVSIVDDAWTDVAGLHRVGTLDSAGDV